MTESEKRIRILEDKAAAPDSDTPFIRTLALCEIARQLSRLGDIYCWCHETADPTTLAEIFRKEKKP